MEYSEGESSPPSPAEILLQKIQELELGHAHLKQEMSKLATDRHRRQRSHSTSPHRRPRRSIGGVEIDAAAVWKRGSASFGGHLSRLQRESSSRDSWTGGGGVGGGGGGGPAAVDLTDKQYLNIMQSMGQSVHVHDEKYQLIYWNKSAEKLYGFSAEEALGEDVIALLTDPRDHDAAYKILDRVLMGENWTGQFPVVSRKGKKFLIVATNTPLYDDAGAILGGICVSTDSAPFRQANSLMSDFEIDSCKIGRVHHQPLQAKFPSKLLYSPSEVIEPEMMSGEEDVLRDGVHGDNGGASTSGVDTYHSAFGVFSSDQESVETSEMKPGISKVNIKADSLSGKRSLSWQETKSCRSGWPGSQTEQDIESVNYEVSEMNRTTNYEASGYWSSSVKVNSYSSASSSSGSSSNAVNAVDIDPRSLDYDIMWEELTIGEQIGQGSCGVVYRALWYGSDVAVKIFSRLEYSDEVILSFKQEVSLMKRLRHPNILLFMGAVTSSERLCIVTEFLPRGSLFGLLKKCAGKLEKRRLIQMALDIARGMNYLHRYNPPIVHRDLKSSNLLVDKNWTVKVGDFGLSRLKHETYLTTRTGKGTPQWMAPEVLRSEPSNEKADVYSFGVILWELVTHKIPWGNLNPMQVIGAVGFMNQRLDIPDDVEPQWASLIESCFSSEPKSRPSFQELVEQLKDMQKKNAVQVQAGRNAQKEV